jgi:hypothetical protein
MKQSFARRSALMIAFVFAGLIGTATPLRIAAAQPDKGAEVNADKSGDESKSSDTTANGTATALRINDFPTQTRVEYVIQCMAVRDAPQQELLYKCVCAIDEIASRVNHDEYVALSTFANAFTIAGERGAVLRERPDARLMTARYKEVIGTSEKACFLKPVK